MLKTTPLVPAAAVLVKKKTLLPLLLSIGRSLVIMNILVTITRAPFGNDVVPSRNS